MEWRFQIKGLRGASLLNSASPNPASLLFCDLEQFHFEQQRRTRLDRRR